MAKIGKTDRKIQFIKARLDELRGNLWKTSVPMPDAVIRAYVNVRVDFPKFLTRLEETPSRKCSKYTQIALDTWIKELTA